MPRKPRVFLPSVPCHVISRGNNRDVCFYTDQDYFFYLECLYDACSRNDVLLHAYVLMTNHVHLLLNPSDEIGIPKVMQSIGRRYVQYINMRYRRSGTLFEGRYKSSLVDAEQYLFSCYRYIELNPIRANMVEHPLDYRWSSYHSNAGVKRNKFITPHELYRSLGMTETHRHEAYRELFSIELGKELVHDIQRASTFSMPLGGSCFQAQIEEALGRKLGYAKRGRPSK